MKKKIFLYLLFGLFISSNAMAKPLLLAEKFQQAQQAEQLILIDIYDGAQPVSFAKQNIKEYFTENPESKIQLLTVDFIAPK
jgi:hypothetical protein